MKTLLITMMCRNNEKYIPYFFKCLDLVENEKLNYKIHYLIYTNNNTDNTLKLLEDNNRKNFEIININYSKEFLKKPRIEKLHYLRDDFYKKIKLRHFDYLLMLDTQIFFNGDILKKSLGIIEENNFEAVTVNTISSYFPIYYDVFSLSTCNEKNYDISKYHDPALIYFHYKTFKEDIINIESAFGGFTLYSNKICNENLNYTDYDFKNKHICEHKKFNEKIDLKFITSINPIWVKEDDDEINFKRSYKIIKRNKANNKPRIILNIFLVLILFILIFLNLYKFNYKSGLFYFSIIYFILFYVIFI